MIENMKAFVACAGIVCALICAAPAVCEDKAIDQLTGMTNTGKTFDGSDGQRFGMDINVSPSAGDVPVPTPSPAGNYDVGTSSGTQNSNFSVNTSSQAVNNASANTAKPAPKAVPEQKKATKKGTEVAE